MKRLGGMKEKLEKEYASKYNPDPDPSGVKFQKRDVTSVLSLSLTLFLDPFATFEPPNLNLKKKSGHLFMKGYGKHQLLRTYFYF